MVASAQHEILILDHRPSLTSSRFYTQTPAEAGSRSKYYEELTQKALSKTRDGEYFRYKRVVQLEEGPTHTWNTSVNMDTVFAAHCREIVAFRNRVPKAVASIKTSRVFFPRSTIVIVDCKQVLLELAIVGPDGFTKVEGDLVFHDPEGQLARPLRQLFEHIDGQAMLITEVQ